jgi:pimeloyl-ACP methyl ester carboxylesterase
MMNVSVEKIQCAGYSISADWYNSDTADKSLLLIPGYQSRRERQADFASRVAMKGLNVLVIDYSGHGDSPIKLQNTRPAQHLLETVCAFEWLEQKTSKDRISVMGTSYGAFQAAYLSLYRDFSKLVLRTPALYRPEDMYTPSTAVDRQEAADVYRKDVHAIAKHPLFNQAKVFDGQSLVVVHSEDEDIPKETTDAYIDAFKAETYIATGFRHWSRDPANTPGMLEVHQEKIAEWIAS